MKLYGVAIAAVPKRDDVKVVQVICTPIAVVDGHRHEFEVLEEIKFTDEFNLNDTEQAINCFSQCVDVIELMVALQKESCEENNSSYRPVALDIGNDARNPVNLNAIYMQLFGERFSPVLTYDEILLQKSRHAGFKIEEWDSVGAEVGQLVDSLFSSSSVDYEFVSGIVSREFLEAENDPELRRQMLVAVIAQLKRFKLIESNQAIVAINAVLEGHFLVEKTNSLNELKQKLIDFIDSKYPDQPDPFEAFLETIKNSGVDLPDSHPLKTYRSQRRRVLDHLHMVYPLSYNIVVSHQRCEEETDAAEKAHAQFFGNFFINDEFFEVYQNLQKLLKECTLYEGSFHPAVDLFTENPVDLDAQNFKPNNQDEKILELKHRIDHGDTNAHFELIELAKEIGRESGNRQTNNPDILVYSTPPRGYAQSLELQKTMPRFSFFHWDRAYWEAFHQGFDETYTGPYNSRPKLPLDPRMPPFTDPCAWRIRDQFEIVQGTRAEDGFQDRTKWKNQIVESAARMAQISSAEVYELHFELQ